MSTGLITRMCPFRTRKDFDLKDIEGNPITEEEFAISLVNSSLTKEIQDTVCDGREYIIRFYPVYVLQEMADVQLCRRVKVTLAHFADAEVGEFVNAWAHGAPNVLECNHGATFVHPLTEYKFQLNKSLSAPRHSMKQSKHSVVTNIVEVVSLWERIE